jgi:hypothetical protein
MSPEGTKFRLEANHLGVTAKRQIRDVGHMPNPAGTSICRSGVLYVEYYDVGQKDHHVTGAACNRNDRCNDGCFRQRTWRRLHPM